MINGGTGPVLAFSAVLYSMSKSIGVPFLTFNAWVGLWVTVYLVVGAFIDLNKIIQYATRFTDEIFALLISVIFIINALGYVHTYKYIQYVELCDCDCDCDCAVVRSILYRFAVLAVLACVCCFVPIVM